MARTTPLTTLGIVASLAVHAGVFWGLTLVPRAMGPAPLSSVVEFELPPIAEETPKAEAEPPPPTPEPEPELEEPTQPEPLTPASLADAPAPDTTTAPPEEAPEPTTAKVADLTGLTLTNDSGSSGWASQVGNGRAITAPITARRSKPTPTVQPQQSAGKPTTGAPAVVPLADLSTRPVPPKLDSLLEQHYPTSARQQGKSGNAIVRLRIDSDGKVRLANVVSESDSGFGRACRTTVLGSKWSPPRDHDGQRVATYVSYTCRFRAER